MRFPYKIILTIIASLSIGGTLYAACVQSLNIGGNDFNNTRSLEIDYIFSNDNNNITIKNDIIMDINKTILVGNVTTGDSNYSVLNKWQILPSGKLLHILFNTTSSTVEHPVCPAGYTTMVGSIDFANPNYIYENTPVNSRTYYVYPTRQGSTIYHYTTQTTDGGAIWTHSRQTAATGSYPICAIWK